MVHASFLGIFVLGLVNELSAAAVRGDGNLTLTNYRRPGLSLTFEEEWEALAAAEDGDFDGVEMDQDPTLNVFPEVLTLDLSSEILADTNAALPSRNIVRKNDTISALIEKTQDRGEMDRKNDTTSALIEKAQNRGEMDQLFVPGVDTKKPISKISAKFVQAPRNVARKTDYTSQLIRDMDALGINKDALDFLNMTASAAIPSKPSSSHFLTANICGEKYLCRKGERGPCQPNEVLVPRQNVSFPSAVSSATCSGLASAPWNGCFPARRVGSADVVKKASQGVCVLRYPSRPCFGYPPGYRYSKSTKRCYPCSALNRNEFSGPCSPNKIFIDTDGVYGTCRCRDSNSLLFWGDNNCYRIYSKGPCSSGEWLEPSVNGFGECKRSPCPSKCDGRHIYWKATPRSRGGCYKSFARGPCRHGSYFLIEDYPMKKGRCISRYSPYDPIGLYRGASSQRNNQLSSLWSNFGLYAPLVDDF